MQKECIYLKLRYSDENTSPKGEWQGAVGAAQLRVIIHNEEMTPLGSGRRPVGLR